MEKFNGRNAVITGGASGIGFATAREFARRGARIMLSDIDEAALDSAVSDLRADGVDAHGVVCDVRKLDDVNRLADEAFDAFGDVHLVFNNAGIAYAGPIAQTSHDDWRFVIDVDLWGPIHGVEAFLPRLIAQEADSHIAFTSSFAGLIPNIGLGPYCVAKYGVVALAETLSREVRGNGIGVIGAVPDDRRHQPAGQHRAGPQPGLRPGHPVGGRYGAAVGLRSHRRLGAQRRRRGPPDRRRNRGQPAVCPAAQRGTRLD